MAGHMALRRMSRQMMRCASGLTTIQDVHMAPALQAILLAGDVRSIKDISLIDWDPYSTCAQGNTALLLACKCPDGEKRRALATQLLKAFKADETLQSENNDGDTPLIVAARIGDHKLVEILLDAGANPDAASAEDAARTPLAAALCEVRSAFLQGRGILRGRGRG